MLELLALLGCDRAQGYFTGRPVAAQDFEMSATVPTLRVAEPEPVEHLPEVPPHRGLIAASPCAATCLCIATTATRARCTDAAAMDLCVAAEEPRARL